MTDPDQLERDAAKSRESLSKDVNRMTDKVSPSSFLDRRKAKLKEAGGGMKDKLMGSADSAGQAVRDRANAAMSSVSDATDAAAGKVGDGGAADTLRQQTSGNPVAAGLIAFGVGWLLSSLVPASQVEQTAAEQVEGTVGEPLKQSAKEIAGNLQQPLQDSAASLKQTTTDAVSKTSEHAKSAAGDVKDNARQAQR